MSRIPAFVCLVVAVLPGCSAGGNDRAVKRYGVRLHLPNGWHGKIYVRGERAIADAATFALPRNDDDSGTKAVKKMRRRDVRIVLLEYMPLGAYPARDTLRMFPPLHGTLLLRKQNFVAAFEGIPSSHSFARRTFSTAGRTFDVWVDFGARPARADRLRAANAVLATLRISRR